MENQFQSLLGHFYNFAKSYLGLKKDASINFVSDPINSADVLGKTAHYDPSAHSVTVYVDGRHPKDILRSISHELVHHRQNCQGKMDQPSSTELGYAQNDPHLRGLEKEAYLVGNMCFRDWEDKYKANREVKTIYESIIRNFIKEKTIMSSKDELRNIVKEAVTKVLNKRPLNEMYDRYEDDPYMDELEKEFDFLRDDPEMGGKAPADIQRDMDDEMPGMEDEDEMMEKKGCPHCDGDAPRSECVCGKAMEEESIHEGEPCPNGCNCNQKQEEVVAEGDEMSRTITQIETIGDVVNGVIGMIEDPEAIERLERVDQMVTILLAQMQGVDEASTEKHDDDPALKGDQDELPDHLQKAIIDKADDEKKVDEADLEETDRYDDEEEIAEADDFYAQLRRDARTLSEDWNKDIRNKRSALLNERLMKAWKITK